MDWSPITVSITFRFGSSVATSDSLIASTESELLVKSSGRIGVCASNVWLARVPVLDLKKRKNTGNSKQFFLNTLFLKLSQAVR